MLFSTLISLLLVTAVTASPTRRDVASISAALDAMSKQMMEINTTLNGFNGGVEGTLTALKIQDQVTDLRKDIQAGTTAATSSSPLNDQDSLTIVLGLTGLTGKVYHVLDNIIAKKPAFDRAILGVGSASFLVKADLQNLKRDTNTFGAAFSEKLVESIKDVAPLLISAIDFHYNQALKVYA
ncbi:hypothetical protein MY10362_003935 [Beauveria mimosiformis]